MANVKRLAVLFPALFVFAYSVFLLALISFVKPSNLEKNLTQSLKSYRGTDAQFQDFKFSYFPWPQVQAKEFIFEIPGDPHIKIFGKNFRAQLQGWPLLFGKIVVQSLNFEDADFSMESFKGALWQKVTLNDVILSIGRVRPRKPIPIEIKAAFSEVPNAVFIRGAVTLENLSNQKWRDLAFEGDAKLHRLLLSKLSRILKNDSPFKILEGQLESSLHFSKKTAFPELHLQGNAVLDPLSYQTAEGEEIIKSLPMKIETIADLDWNPESDLLTINKITLLSPLAKVEALGRFAMNTREFKGIRITASEMAIANFPQYILPLKKLIPFNIGFSGASEVEMSLDGSLDHASLDVNWDLTPTLLTYSRYFLKPKDFPMNVLFNCLIENGKQLSGDFSVRIQNTSFKGTISHFNLKQGVGELNVITNKFPLAGWETLIPPLEGYVLEGDMKLLVNWAGAAETEETERGQNILNITLENGSLKGKNWAGIKKVNGVLDLSPFSLEIKKLNGEIEDAPIGLELVIYNLYSDSNSIKGKINSSKLKPTTVLEALENASEKFLPQAAKAWSVTLRELIKRVLSPDEPLENLNIAFHSQKKILSIDSMEFSAYGGTAKSKMELDFSHTPMTYNLSAEIEKVNLARYFETVSPVIKGNLFLNGQFSGIADAPSHFEKSMFGEGLFSVTEGEFLTFDILNAIGEIDGFGEVGLLSNKKTDFSDFRGKFSYRDAKIKMENLTMLSSDLALDASGEVLAEGLLNYRINAYLSSTLTGHFLTPILGKSENFKNKQFGPIPLLLSGAAKAPELKADSRQLEQLKDNLLRKKTQRVLRNFVPEEAVFQTEPSNPKK